MNQVFLHGAEIGMEAGEGASKLSIGFLFETKMGDVRASPMVRYLREMYSSQSMKKARRVC